MAVSISTVGINTADAGTWTRDEALDLLGIGLSIAQFHGEPLSGLAVGVSTFTGGGQVSISNDKYYQDVKPISTSGIGTGASFFITRDDGSSHIKGIAVNRPGYGYTAGEVVTLSAEDIGGSINGASNMELTLVIDATISGGSGYALTFTGAGGTSIQSRGYDKNGYQSIGTDRTYTFTEGDTISFHNDTTNESYSYENMGLTRYIDNRETSQVVSIANTEVVWSFGQTIGRGITSSWTPSAGEAGTYFFVRLYCENEDYTTIIVEPAAPEAITSVSYGSTTSWFDQNPEADTNSAGRVLKLDVDTSKEFGTTYHMIYHSNGSALYTNGYTGWMPIDTKTRYPGYYQDGMASYDYLGGHGHGKRWAGSYLLDGGDHSDIFNYHESMLDNYYMDGTSYGMRHTNYQKLCDIPTSYTAYELNLKIYKSAIDPNFVVFIWKSPTLSSSDINDNLGGCFFFHNFTSSIIDLDYYNLGTITRVDAYNSGNFTSGSDSPYLQFYTYLVNLDPTGAKRSAMRGYAGDEDWYVFDQYESSPHVEGADAYATRLYYRPDSSDERYTSRMTTNNSYHTSDIPSSASSNNVVKGLPLSTKILPCPYYIPDDFVLIQFDYNAISANIQNGDTVTISGSEVYEVITGSYDTNDQSRTKGILFCARIV